MRLHARDGFVNRHGADGYGRVAQDGLADLRNVAAGGEVHDRVGAVMHGGVELFQLFIDVGRDGGVADVGIDLAETLHADAHGFELGMIDIGGDDHPAGGDFVADQFGRNLLAIGHVEHLFGDQAFAGEMHLRHVGIAGAGCLFLTTDDP